jgi:hypothetical protein
MPAFVVRLPPLNPSSRMMAVCAHFDTRAGRLHRRPHRRHIRIRAATPERPDVAVSWILEHDHVPEPLADSAQTGRRKRHHGLTGWDDVAAKYV